MALTDAQVRDHVMAFFVAGHEPLAAALTWTWMVLATQPDLTEPLRHAKDHTPDDTPPTRLTQTLAEVLRLYPPVYVVIRRVITPIDLPPIGTLPVGLTLAFSPFVMHRHPEWYPAPIRFDPARFDPAAVVTRPRLRYLPFGIGAHQCIGMPLALQQLTTVMQTVLQMGVPRITDSIMPGFKPQIVLEPNRVLLAFLESPSRASAF